MSDPNIGGNPVGNRNGHRAGNFATLTREAIELERRAFESEERCWIGFAPVERRAWSQVLDAFRPKEHSVLTQLMIRQQLNTTGVVVLSSWSARARLFDEAGFTPHEYYELNTSLHMVGEQQLLQTMKPTSWQKWLEKVREGITPIVAMRDFVGANEISVNVSSSAENVTGTNGEGE